MKKYLCFLLCIAALAFISGCSKEVIELDEIYTSDLGFSVKYPSGYTLEELESGAKITLPSGSSVISINVTEDIVNFSEAAQYLGIDEANKDLKDIQLTPDFKGKKAKTESGKGKEKTVSTFRYGILNGKLFSVAIQEKGRVSSSDASTASQIAESFRFTDESMLKPQNLSSKKLNVNITAPGDCKVIEDNNSLLVILPGERVMLELLSLPYSGDSEAIVDALKTYYQGLRLKRDLKVERDAKNPSNGFIFSLDYTDGNKDCSVDAYFTAFDNKVYAMGIKGERAQITRWKSVLESIMNTFSFINQSPPDPNLDLIRERAVPSVLGEPLPQGTPLPDSHFNTAVLLGDSLTYGFQAYDIDVPPIIVANESISVGQFATVATVKTAQGQSTMLDALLAVKPEKIYIMLGINSMSMSEDAFIGYYNSMVTEIKEKLPNAEIYVESILPVTASRAMSGNSNFINNERIDRYNKRLLQLCWQQELYYVDVAEAFRDSNGNMPEHLSADGIHIGPKSYKVWYEYLKKHHK